MAALGTHLDELNRQVEGLLIEVTKLNAVIQDAEQQSIAHPKDLEWLDVVDVHRAMVNKKVAEIRRLQTQIVGVPTQRPPSAWS